MPTMACYFDSDFLLYHGDDAVFTAQVQPHGYSARFVWVLESEVVISGDREILANIA